MTIRELYEKIGGDYEDVTKRLPKEELIGKFIRMYNTGAEIDSLVTAYRNKEYANVFEIAHNLKGMSANLSLNRMNQTMVEICEAVRHGAPAKDITDLVEESKAQHDELSLLIKELE